MEVSGQPQAAAALSCEVTPGYQLSKRLGGHQTGLDNLETTESFDPAGNQHKIPLMSNL
jgi:hypothetical protein